MQYLHGYAFQSSTNLRAGGMDCRLSGQGLLPIGTVCAVPYAQPCSSGCVSCDLPRLFADQKQFVPYNDHPGDCCSFGLRLPKLKQVLPMCLMQVISLPGVSHAGFPRCRVRSRGLAYTKGESHKPRLVLRPLAISVLLRRFQTGLSGIELRLVGLTLAEASWTWSHRCS